MKITVFLLATVVLSSSMIIIPKPKVLKSYSYFCVSQAVSEATSKKFLEMNSWPGNNTSKFELPSPARIQREGSTREVIFFTKLRDTLIEESAIKSLTKAWASWVNNKCVNQFGCTSDLLYYEDKTQAMTQFAKTIAGFSDDKKYEMRLADY